MPYSVERALSSGAWLDVGPDNATPDALQVNVADGRVPDWRILDHVGAVVVITTRCGLTTAAVLEIPERHARQFARPCVVCTDGVRQIRVGNYVQDRLPI